MDDTDALAPEGASLRDHGADAQGAAEPARPSYRSSESSGVNPTAPQTAGERVRTVPYGALAEERARRKELQRELHESIASRQLLQGRLDTLHQMAANPAPSQPPRDAGQHDNATADFPMDVIAAAGALDRASAVQDPAGDQDDGAFRTQLLQSVRSYAAERPDFMEAYQHAREARVSELSALGYTTEEATAITFDNELELIRNAYATGRNPAELIYDYAAHRGYQSGGSPELHAGLRPGFRTQAPVASPVGGMTEAEKVALAARGQAGAKSLSSAGGGAVGTLTLEALASLSEEEFAEATRGDRWQKLLQV